MKYSIDQSKIIKTTPIFIPSPPKPILCRIIKEGTIGDCPKCKSTTIKRFIWFGRSIGCIHTECTNYYKNK